MRTAPSGVDRPDGLPWPRRAVAGLAQLTGVATVLIDSYSVNLALPSIAADFGRDPAQSTAIVTAFQVVLIACLLPMAALAQRVGYARTYITGLLLYALMALISAISPSFETLVAARMAQGLAASGIVAVNLALLRMIVPSALLGRALGVNAMVVALASSAGPMIAGLVLAVASWHWVFGLAVPFALAAAIGGAFSFPDNPRSTGPIDLWPFFDALEGMPLAVIRGANSDLLTRQTVGKMLRRHPDMLVAEVPDRGHIPFLDEPEAVFTLQTWAAML